jgi:hypothetical protein
MAFTIFNKMAKPGSELYYDSDFRLVLETHLNLLINRAAAVEDIPLDLFYQYEGDFYGYLVEKGIPPEYHFIHLRINGMTNPNQFAKEMRDPSNPLVRPVLIRPNQNQIDNIVRLYMSRKFK